MAELVRGVSVPLFDRFSPIRFKNESASRLLTPEQLQESVATELARLMNTRSALTVAEFLQCAGTTLDYGLPDVGFLSPRSRSDLDVLESVVRRAIRCFEPRLQDVKVSAVSSPSLVGKPFVSISGLVSIGLKLRQLNFELHIDPSQKSHAKVN